MPHALLLVLVGTVVGMAMLAIPLMSQRSTRAWFHLPLAGLLLVIVILVLPPLAHAVLPSFKTSVIAAGLPALMLLGPLFGWYVRALTSELEWRWSRRELLSLLPALVALFVVASFLILPFHVREAMVLRGELPDAGASAFIAALTWLLILFWVPQSLYYLIRAGKQLSQYRQRLKQVFASTEQREMNWLTLFIAVLAVMWLVVVVAAVGANVFDFSVIDRPGLTVLAVIAAWVLSICGLTQRPGFQGHYAAERPDELEPATVEKYSRSALDQPQSERIANKIENAMVVNKLYLDADLTLSTLAKAVGAPANYVSQTLNKTLGETFFDYVNKKRIEAAQTLLRDTDKTALDIAYAVGFNARSSFYKAFRRWVGMSPGEYRKLIAAQADTGAP